MEIKLSIHSLDEATGREVRYLDAWFVFVARNATQGKPMRIPALEVVTESEVKHKKEGDRAAQVRKDFRNTNLQTVPPKVEEVAIVHSLFQETHLRVGGAGAEGTNAYGQRLVWMQDTALTNTIIMNPQSKNVHGKVCMSVRPQLFALRLTLKMNVHGKIFGGFLMRQAFELAFTTAYKFNDGKRPIFRSLGACCCCLL